MRDARKALILEITDRDVKSSKEKDPSNCAAAVACKRQEKVKNARVHVTQTYIDRGKYWERYTTPNRMRTEIVSFDRGAMFTASEYTLKVPDESHKLGAYVYKKREDKRKNHAGGSPRTYYSTSGVRASAHKNIWSHKVKA